MATIFDGVSELQYADGSSETLCDGCYAISCKAGFVIRRFPDGYKLPVISCVNGRWTYHNNRRAGVIAHATNRDGQLRSKRMYEYGVRFNQLSKKPKFCVCVGKAAWLKRQLIRKTNSITLNN